MNKYRKQFITWPEGSNLDAQLSDYLYLQALDMILFPETFQKLTDCLLKQHEEEIKQKKAYIDGNFEKQEAKVSFNLCIGIEKNTTSSQILNQIKSILYDLKSI